MVTNVIFKYIFLIDNYNDLIKISLKFVRQGPLDYKSSLVQVVTKCWVKRG